MEYDPPSIPEHTPTDTPEVIQECLEYKAAIEQQLNDWCDTLKSSHPAVVVGGIAKIIASNCTPKPRPTDDLNGSPFETGFTPKEAERVTQKRRQLGLISTLAQDPSFDTEPTDQVSDDVLDIYFERLAAFLDDNNGPQTSINAVQYLRRLYRADAQLSQQLIPENEATSQNTRYVRLLNRIYDDLF